MSQGFYQILTNRGITIKESRFLPVDETTEVSDIETRQLKKILTGRKINAIMLSGDILVVSSEIYKAIPELNKKTVNCPYCDKPVTKGICFMIQHLDECKKQKLNKI